jgi:hypothetical protein
MRASGEVGATDVEARYRATWSGMSLSRIVPAQPLTLRVYGVRTGQREAS